MARLGHRGGTFVLLLAAAVIALLIPAAPAEAAGLCATPGRDGSASLTGIVNTYYPGLAGDRRLDHHHPRPGDRSLDADRHWRPVARGPDAGRRHQFDQHRRVR